MLIIVYDFDNLFMIICQQSSKRLIVTPFHFFTIRLTRIFFNFFFLLLCKFVYNFFFFFTGNVCVYFEKRMYIMIHGGLLQPSHAFGSAIYSHSSLWSLSKMIYEHEFIHETYIHTQASYKWATKITDKTIKQVRSYTFYRLLF